MPDHTAEIQGAWEALGKDSGVVEQAIDLEREISVLVARSPSGEVKVYPAAWNHHEHQILAWSVIPAPIPDRPRSQARDIAEAIADTFQLEGILAIEFFVTKDGELLVNELAPRPHNSYHASERACVTGQFEQHVRAICDLPLGDVDVVQPAAIANLLGEVWLDPDGAPREPNFAAALSVAGVRLHLYEKLRPRKGRKMGHLSAVADTPEEAVARVQRAMQLLAPLANTSNPLSSFAAGGGSAFSSSNDSANTLQSRDFRDSLSLFRRGTETLSWWRLCWVFSLVRQLGQAGWRL
jgi:5-(carboxyamino)imidazole ribonucleotide synthase